MAKKKDTNTEAPEQDKQVKEKAPAKHSDYDYVIQNKKARTLTKHRKAVIIAGVILLLILLIVGIFFGIYSAIDVNKNRIEVGTSGGRALSLSMNPGMEPANELITIVGPSDMTDTSLGIGKYTPIEEYLPSIIAAEGSFTGEDSYYIAGTFYIKNVTDDTKTYTEQLKFLQCDKGTAKALRVMVIRNEVITVYAHPRTNNGELVTDEAGNPIAEEVVPGQGYAERYLVQDANGTYTTAKNNANNPWMCENFYCDEDGSYETYIVNAPNNTIDAGAVVRYSIIIWFEGWDNECVDDILGGVVKLSLSFICEED